MLIVEGDRWDKQLGTFSCYLAMIVFCIRNLQPPADKCPLCNKSSVWLRMVVSFFPQLKRIVCGYLSQKSLLDYSYGCAIFVYETKSILLKLQSFSKQWSMQGFPETMQGFPGA